MYVEDEPEFYEADWMIDAAREERTAKRVLAKLFGSFDAEEE